MQNIILFATPSVQTRRLPTTYVNMKLSIAMLYPPRTSKSFNNVHRDAPLTTTANQILLQPLDYAPCFRTLHNQAQQDLMKIADPWLFKKVKESIENAGIHLKKYKLMMLCGFIASYQTLRSKAFSMTEIRKSYAPLYVDEAKLRRPTLEGLLVKPLKRDLLVGEFDNIKNSFPQLMDAFNRNGRMYIEDKELHDIAKIQYDLNADGTRLVRTDSSQLQLRNRWRAHGLNSPVIVRRRAEAIKNAFQKTVDAVAKDNDKIHQQITLSCEFTEQILKHVNKFEPGLGEREVANRLEAIEEQEWMEAMKSKGFTVPKIRAFVAVRTMFKPSGHTSAGKFARLLVTPSTGA